MVIFHYAHLLHNIIMEGLEGQCLIWIVTIEVSVLLISPLANSGMLGSSAAAMNQNKETLNLPRTDFPMKLSIQIRSVRFAD